MEVFFRKKDGARELLTKENIIFRPGHLLFGGKECHLFLSFRLSLLSVKDGEGLHDRSPPWSGSEYSRLSNQDYVSGRGGKQQVGQALNLGLVSWA